MITPLLAYDFHGLLASLSDTCQSYMRFYKDFLVEQWMGMTPNSYAALLGTIAFVGWLLMRSRLK